jgi:hypothetical protein
MVGYRYCVCVAHDRYMGDMKMVRHCGCAYMERCGWKLLSPPLDVLVGHRHHFEYSPIQNQCRPKYFFTYTAVDRGRSDKDAARFYLRDGLAWLS